MIVTARSVLCEEIDSRFIDTCFSDARLIQIYISKGGDPSKILSTDNLISAKALYMKWLRNLLTQGVIKLGARQSVSRHARRSPT